MPSVSNLVITGCFLMNKHIFLLGLTGVAVSSDSVNDFRGSGCDGQTAPPIPPPGFCSCLPLSFVTFSRLQLPL